MNILSLIGREAELFNEYLKANDFQLKRLISDSLFLVKGGSDSIGEAVTREIFKRDSKLFHIFNISDTNTDSERLTPDER